MLFLLVMAAVQFCVRPLPASSEVYQWTDEKGNTFYSDSPPPGVNPKLKKLRTDKIERPEVRDAPASAVRAVPQKRDLRDITVILYSTDG